jgi:long-chain acyl-CoA synthetase
MGDGALRAIGGLETIGSVIEGLSARGGRPALVAFAEQGVEIRSYRELAERVRLLARGLCGIGVKRGDHVAIVCGNGPEWVAACLAVISAGAVIVPVDVQAGDEALCHVLDDSGARHVFTTANQAVRLEQLEKAMQSRLILLDGDEEDPRSWRRLPAGRDEDLPSLRADDGAALFYTSGTTGVAKGVPLSHANLAFQIESLLGAGLVAGDDRILLPLPLHHVYPFVMGMLTPLAAGLPIILPQSLTGPQLARALREGEATLIVGVPRLYAALYSGIEEKIASVGPLTAALFRNGVSLFARVRRLTGLNPGRIVLRPVRRRFGPRLRVLASGGAALDPELASRLEGLGWRVAIGYGLTETSPLLALNPPDGKRPGSVGRPIPGVEISIDPAVVREGGDRSGGSRGEGEILARGPNVFSGYRNRPEETSKVFSEGWFRTGDLGYFDSDRNLYVTGRVSTLIVTPGGKNVQPETVEAVYGEHPLIHEIGVLQRDGHLVAVVVPDQERLVSEKDSSWAIREAIQESSRRLPSYQRISDYAISREPLEYTRLGKLKRHVLENRYERSRSEAEARDGLPSGPVAVHEMSEEDQALLRNPAARSVWSLLAERFPEKRLAPDTSPQLDLGIDSLGWVNLTLEIGGRTGVEIGEAAIGRIDTLRDLLSEVALGTGRTAHQASPLERPEEVLDERQMRWLRPLGRVASALAGGMFSLNRAIMRGLFRLRAEGLENLPEEGPFIVAPNHVSYLDAFVVAAALPRDVQRRTYWAGWTGAAFGNPLTRRISRLAQVVPVDPERAGLSSLVYGAAVLARGQNLVWFAEGERSGTGSLQQFKPGVGMILDHHPVPVVPVFIRGTYEAMPRGQLLRRLERVSVTFGEPFDPRGPDGNIEPREQVVEALHGRVFELGQRE